MHPIPAKKIISKSITGGVVVHSSCGVRLRECKDSRFSVVKGGRDYVFMTQEAHHIKGEGA